MSVGGKHKGVVIEILVTQAQLQAEITIINVRKPQFALVVREGDVIRLVSFGINVDVIVSKSVTQGETPQEGAPERILQFHVRIHAKTPRQGKARPPQIAVRDGGIEQDGRHFLRIEAKTEIQGTHGLHAQNQFQLILRPHSAQTVGDTGESSNAVKLGYGLMQIVAGDKAVVFDAHLAPQPFLVPLVDADEMNAGDSHSVVHLHHISPRLFLVFRLFQPQLALQGHQLIPLRAGDLLAAGYQRVDGVPRETGRRIRRDIRLDVNIDQFLVVIIFLNAQKRDKLVNNAGDRLQTFLVLQIRLHINPNYHIRPHSPSHVDREVVRDSPVHQHHAPLAHRGEHPRDSHAGPQAERQIALVKNDILAIDQVARHAGERNGKGGKIKGVVITDSKVREKIIYVLTADEPRRKGNSAFFPDGHGKEVFFRGFLFRKRQIIAIHLVAQKEGPILTPHQRVHRTSIITNGVQTAHDGPHAGAHDAIDGYPGLLQNFQHSDMRHTLGPTATQNQPDFFALGVRGHGHQQCQQHYSNPSHTIKNLCDKYSSKYRDFIFNPIKKHAQFPTLKIIS